MSDTASLEVLRELYELAPDWIGDGKWWSFVGVYNMDGSTTDEAWEVTDVVAESVCPAFSAGYLLRKLPRKLKGVNSKQRDGNFNLYASRGKTAWIASYADEDGSIIRRLKKDAESQNNRNFWFMHGSADTPEDAMVKLCIVMFKEGILPISGRD